MFINQAFFAPIFHFPRPDEGSSTEARVLRIQSNDTLDVKYGFDRYKEPVDRLGWLINMHPVSQIFLYTSFRSKRNSEANLPPPNFDQTFARHQVSYLLIQVL